MFLLVHVSSINQDSLISWPCTFVTANVLFWSHITVYTHSIMAHSTKILAKLSTTTKSSVLLAIWPLIRLRSHHRSQELFSRHNIRSLPMPEWQREKKNLSRVEGESQIILNIFQEQEEMLWKEVLIPDWSKGREQGEISSKIFPLAGLSAL